MSIVESSQAPTSADREALAQAADRIREIASEIEQKGRAIGEVLLSVSERGLWRAGGYDSLLDWAAAEAGVATTHAYRLMDLALCTRELSPAGETLQLTTRQTRILAPILKREGSEAARELFEQAAAHPDGPTPDQLQSVRDARPRRSAPRRQKRQRREELAALHARPEPRPVTAPRECDAMVLQVALWWPDGFSRERLLKTCETMGMPATKFGPALRRVLAAELIVGNADEYRSNPLVLAAATILNWTPPAVLSRQHDTFGRT